ncbi:hypothetical protein [Longimicrobium sp.]|uniref:hypothetical protein n=1 Tax=Longimicrobium sp. TaxID=2029185 RepID=UPI002E2F38AB|nr:hypothetical protein [Longimicrobium sp.]HEX6038980.1 hypothetical protein [Longimicrobium sp.]
MASPLTLLMPIIPGTNPMVIAAALEKYNAQIDTALSSIGTVHYARFLLLDRSVPNLQPGAAASNELVLAVITEYDGTFSKYIGDFVAQIGDVFNALLAFVVGGDAVIPVQNNVAAFNAFVTANDASQHFPNNGQTTPTAPTQPGGGLYQAYPQTVQVILASV